MDRILLISLAIFPLAGTTWATEALPVRNDTNRVMKLWVYPYTVGDWRRPIRFAPSRRKLVYFNSGESYYLVFMDDQGRETPIGRYTITRVLQQNPTYELSIARMVKCTAAKERVKYVWCPRHRVWHKIRYTDCRPVEGEYEIKWLSQHPSTVQE